MGNMSQQLLREIAERIRLRCGDVGRCGNVKPCADCRRDAEDLESIAKLAPINLEGPAGGARGGRAEPPRSTGVSHDPTCPLFGSWCSCGDGK